VTKLQRRKFVNKLDIDRATGQRLH